MKKKTQAALNKRQAIKEDASTADVTGRRAETPADHVETEEDPVSHHAVASTADIGMFSNDQRFGEII
ncbi:hypothetical protein EOD39_11855 [Acipenser ruthenus]|uniref:Uncharacterized protein n=1 Tax=Acipenser ruthenus TaxID=7906 RepID=A0A444UMK0_ACIRT|nr:hypothetical protein EOD39_11855 [Acipenser ruthenus]